MVFEHCRDCENHEKDGSKPAPGSCPGMRLVAWGCPKILRVLPSGDVRPCSSMSWLDEPARPCHYHNTDCTVPILVPR
jgi:hypothetical protein